tara:strand:+ start:2169 stop:2708 length:540 start_codon:yes stop_codon:yes gene_type:complete
MDIENHIFKDLKFLKSPNFNERPNDKEISLVIIHSISLPPKSYGNNYVEDFFLNKLCIDDHSYFKEIQNLKVSSHLYIKRDGELIQFVPFDKRAWHAGKSTYKGVDDCNNFSIGIELEGADDDCYSDEQYKMLTLTTQKIIDHYPLIDKHSIAGHSDVSPSRKTDPGKKFDWERFLNAL